MVPEFLDGYGGLPSRGKIPVNILDEMYLFLSWKLFGGSLSRGRRLVNACLDEICIARLGVHRQDTR